MVLAVVGPLAIHWGGLPGLAAGSLAAVSCWIGAVAGFLIGRRMAPNVLGTLLAGMAFRMGVPLAFGAAIHFLGRPLAQAGFLYYLLLFYPAALLMETMSSVPRRPRS